MLATLTLTPVLGVDGYRVLLDHSERMRRWIMLTRSLAFREAFYTQVYVGANVAIDADGVCDVGAASSCDCQSGSTTDSNTSNRNSRVTNPLLAAFGASHSCLLLDEAHVVSAELCSMRRSRGEVAGYGMRSCASHAVANGCNTSNKFE